MLTEEERARIRAEEIFRIEISRELQAGRPRLSRREWIWSLLNSSFALWVLSSVVLAGLTASFARYQAQQNERIRKVEVVQRLDTEISNRLSQAQAGLRIDEKRIKQGNSYPPASIYSNVVSYLDNSFAVDPGKTRDFSIYQEYRARSFRSLVLELNSVVEPSLRPELRDALAAYEEFADLGSIENKRGKNSEQQTESLKAVNNSLELLNRRLLKPRWRSLELPAP